MRCSATWICCCVACNSIFKSKAMDLPGGASQKGLHRIGEVPMYAVDALCRRSDALQKTGHADSSFVGLNPADAAAAGLSDGDSAIVSQGGESAELIVRVRHEVPEGGAWVRSATCATRALGDMQGAITVAAAGGAA